MQPPKKGLSEATYQTLYSKYLLVELVKNRSGVLSEVGLGGRAVCSGLLASDCDENQRFVSVVDGILASKGYDRGVDSGSNVGNVSSLVGCKKETPRLSGVDNGGSCNGGYAVCVDGVVGEEKSASDAVSRDSIANTGSIGVDSFSSIASNGDRAMCEVSEAADVTSVAVGKHHRRNVAKREKKRASKRVENCGGDEIANGEKSQCDLGTGCTRIESNLAPSSSVGYFSDCSYEVRKKLKESRAAMLVAQNELRTVEAEEKIRLARLEKTTRLAESRFELSRVTVEDKLAQISKRRFGVGGSAETVVSSAAPSLSSGSVSPNSSISVAEEMKLRSQLGKALEEVAKLKEEVDVKKRTDDLGYDWGRPASPESIYGDDVIAGEFVERYTPGIC